MAALWGRLHLADARPEPQGHALVGVHPGQAVGDGELRIHRAGAARRVGATQPSPSARNGRASAGLGDEAVGKGGHQRPIGGLQAVGRQRVGPRHRPRRPALRPRHAHQRLRLGVVGLEIVVADGPVLPDAVARLEREVGGQHPRRAPPPALRSPPEAQGHRPDLVRRQVREARRPLPRRDPQVRQLRCVRSPGAALEHDDARGGGRVGEPAVEEEGGREARADDSEIVAVDHPGADTTAGPPGAALCGRTGLRWGRPRERARPSGRERGRTIMGANESAR